MTSPYLLVADKPADKPDPAAHYFGEVELVDQNGATQRLYSDLLKDHTVVIYTFFATCAGACPVMTGKFESLQKDLGDRIGKDLRILSISVEPEKDTPAALKAYAGKYHAKPGWYFLTGKKENVDAALRKLGQYVDDPSNHLNVVLIGNNRTGLWKKAFGLASAEELLKVINSVLDDNG